MKRIPVDLEYIFKASPAILYKFLTTPACLVRWFCDGVDINADVYTFTWDGNDENDPASGSGWLKLKDKNSVDGRIKFHQGDSSSLVAKRMK